MSITTYRWTITILAGVVVLLAIVLASSRVVPGYERSFHKSAIGLSGELLAKGETQRVQQAISTYNNVAATGTTYRAAMQMWDVLNHGPKE